MKSLPFLSPITPMHMRHALKTDGYGLEAIITEGQKAQNQSDPFFS
jgi:hypothetical protein